MIRATGLNLSRGTKILLRDAEFVVHPGERIGVVGRNGAGKSTLFSLLRGELDADAGDLSLPADWRITSVAQEIAEAQRERPAREFVIDGDVTLRSLQHDRAGLSPDDGHRIAELEAALADAGAWDAASRAEQLLAGLGFTPSEWSAPVRSFSGGWQMRLSLARALMAPSELLLLDEPTNHLDLDAMLWLERWLQSYSGAVLLISHDTEFLDAVATAILHFDQQRLVRYRGHYQDFLSQRAERLRQTQLAHERQQRETARLQSFIDRFRAKATKAKQAQSRVKALARMQVLAPLQTEHGVQFSLPEPSSMPDPLLTLHDASLGYPADGSNEQPTLEQVSLAVRGGARIGVLGVNGAGKSTLIRSLVGDLPLLAGERHASRNLEAGYFAQHQLDMLRVDESPLQHLARQAPDERELALRNYLGGFGFSGDTVHHAVHTLSGGEKARLALALIVWRRPNLLLLDEPSNHLDVETRTALATALAGYEGSVLLVSHDRHLLRSTVDEFWIVADGQVQTFDGDLDDYREWLLVRAANERAQMRGQRQTATDTAPDRRTQRRLEAEQRQRLAKLRKPLERRLQNVEAAMVTVTARLQTLDAAIASPDFYDEAQRQTRPQVLTEHGELSKRQAELEDDWLTVQEALEDLTQQAGVDDA